MSAPPRGAELRAIYAASVAAIAPVEWADEKVVTTEVLARAYGTEPVRIRQNFSAHADRFEEGKHFFRIAGKKLLDLRVSFGDSQISPKARTMVLWTERGAARHAKMLETDAAWDVFEALEDNYFRHRGDQVAPADVGDVKQSTVRDREPLLHAAISMVVKHHLPFHKVYQTMNYFAGSTRFAVMTKDQVAEAEQFIERLLLGQDTRHDWLRIGANKRELTGDDAQPELLGFSVQGVFGNK